MAEIRCTIFKNATDHGEGRLVTIHPSMDLDHFLKLSGERLKIKAERAYLEGGTYVHSLKDISNQDKIFISTGEPFYKYDSSQVKTYKIAVLGAGGVGKSCLSMRYVRSTFVDVYDPTIEDAFRHQTTVDGKTCILDILDTAGQEDMRMLRRQWVEDRDGFLYVFSLIDQSTFEDLSSFHELVETVKDSLLSTVPRVVAGNKLDIPEYRVVSREDAAKAAKSFGADYIETSAKTGEGVNQAFEAVVKGFMRLEPAPAPNQTGRRRSVCVLL